MKKRILAFLLAGAMATAFVSCGTDKESDSTKSNTAASEDTTTGETDGTETTTDAETTTESTEDTTKGSNKKASKGEDLTKLSEDELRTYLTDLVSGITNYKTDMAVDMDMDFDMRKLFEAQGMSVDEMTAEEKEQMAAMGMDIDKPMNMAMSVKMKIEADEDTVHTNEATLNLGGGLFGSLMGDSDKPIETEVYVDLSSFDGSSYVTYTLEDGKWMSSKISTKEKDETVSSSLIKPEIVEKAKSLKAEKASGGYKIILTIDSDKMDSEDNIGETLGDIEGLELGLIFTIENDELTAIEFDADDFMAKATEQLTKSMTESMGDASMTDAIKINKFDITMSVYDIGKVSVDIPQNVIDTAIEECGTTVDSSAA